MKIEKITPQIAALYLGQKCDIEWNEGNESHYKGEIWYNAPLYFGLLQRIETGEISITPHLRHLESITDEECMEVHKIIYGREYAGFTPVKEWMMLKFPGESDAIQDAIGKPAAWLYLVSKGFDLFGLIDNGLAKEITTKTNEP